MKAFEANFTTIVTRFYLMMAIIVIAGFTGIWAIALLALPIFLTAILGTQKTQKTTPTTDAKQVELANNQFKDVA